MALVGIELETLVSEPDALTTRPQKTPNPGDNLPYSNRMNTAVLFLSFKLDKSYQSCGNISTSTNVLLTLR